MGDSDSLTTTGPMKWLDDVVTTTVYATDNSIYQVTPQRVGLPETSGQLAAALAANHAGANPRPIVARGGGTGTNGQSLTNGLVIDLKRNLNRIESIDVARRRCVVEPGVVTAELNARLAPHGLFWPPHTSTLSRATVGGMISTDAAGKGSLIYGKTHRHVTRLEVLLADGTAWVAEPVSEREAHRRARGDDAGARLWHRLLELAIGPGHTDGVDLGLPDMARRFSGYGIDRFRHDGIVDPIALLAGAEGTLAVITKATLALSALPTFATLIVASYDTFGDALDDAIVLRETAPSAIESFDETTLARGRSSPAWPALGKVLGEHDGAVLMLEYDEAGESEVASVLGMLAATGRCRSSAMITDRAEQRAAWKVREDAVGLLAKVATGGPQRSARPTAFVEDCAVPVQAMPQFIAEFRAVLDEAGLTYGMFGHADVGCVHVRPALDLTDPVDRAMVADITAKVNALVHSHGGLLWGEHGRGFRGASVESVLPPATVALMRQVKSAFDPRDLLNPGKLYRPIESTEPLLDVDTPPMRGQFDQAVPVGIRRRFDSAFACNGNGLCHHYAADEVMCPSYKATRDPALSPKGRADLLRRWLRDPQASPGFGHEIAENLHQCLSCGACTGRCPVEVDIPEMKSRFLEAYHQRHRRPLNHHLLSRFESLAHGASMAPALMRLGAAPAGRLLGLVDLPVPSARGRTGLARFGSAGQGHDVVILADVFTSILERDTVVAAVRVLESVGYSVAVTKFVGSGKFDHVKGRRTRFAKAARRQAELVRRVVAAGAVPVVIEPAIELLHRHEYPAIVAGYPSEAVRSIAALLRERGDQLARRDGKVRLLGHCTERATNPGSVASWGAVLTAAGYTVTMPEIGCCGMAGIFGHEAAHQTLSRQIWDLSWARQMEPSADSADEHVVATGYSCRSQVKRFAGRTIGHPLHLL